MSILVLTSDTLIGTPATGNIEYNGQFFGTDSNASRAQMQRIAQGTAVASTSGTSIDFTGIPAWVKRITVMFSGVSTSGTSNYVWQIGSGSVDTTANYSFSRSQNQNAGANSVSNSTTSTYGEFMGNWSSSATSTGHLILTNISSNSWVSSSNVQHVSGTTGMSLAIGSKTLSGTLDRVRITTANGTDTFDAGSINLLLEG